MKPTAAERKRRYRRALKLFAGRDYGAAGAAFVKIAEAGDLFAALARFYAAESYLRLGVERLGQRDFEAAVQAFTQARALNPNHSALPQYLARCFAQLGQFDKAARYSDRELSAGRNPGDARVRLALSLWLDSQPESAMQALHDGLLAEPDHPEWNFQLGVLLSAREEYGPAKESFARTIRFNPQHADALAQLALCHGAEQNHAEAVRHLSLAQRQRPHDAGIGLFLAMACKAAAGAEILLKLDPAVPAAPLAVDVADIEELTRLVTGEPEVVEAFINLPEPGMDENLFQVLSAVIERAILQGEESAELLYHQARIYERLGRTDLAVASCERAVEINPQLVQGLVTLATLYLSTDRRQDAQARLQQVLDLGYEYADVYYHLGCIYRDAGDRDHAKESYRRALQINSRYQAARQALELLAA